VQITDYHAKYYAHELTKRCSSDSVEKLALALSDAQVDLNPHQVEAALFAFRSPFSRGAILADEVGLGKTIEAGLLLSQKWAERKHRLLVIVPANLWRLAPTLPWSNGGLGAPPMGALSNRGTTAPARARLREQLRAATTAFFNGGSS
jgi:hypothetical protein